MVRLIFVRSSIHSFDYLPNVCSVLGIGLKTLHLHMSEFGAILNSPTSQNPPALRMLYTPPFMLNMLLPCLLHQCGQRFAPGKESKDKERSALIRELVSRNLFFLFKMKKRQKEKPTGKRENFFSIQMASERSS